VAKAGVKLDDATMVDIASDRIIVVGLMVDDSSLLVARG
jgi:hypothetical protein